MWLHDISSRTICGKVKSMRQNVKFTLKLLCSYQICPKFIWKYYSSPNIIKMPTFPSWLPTWPVNFPQSIYHLNRLVIDHWHAMSTGILPWINSLSCLLMFDFMPTTYPHFTGIPAINFRDFSSQSQNLLWALEDWRWFRLVNHPISLNNVTVWVLLDLPTEMKVWCERLWIYPPKWMWHCSQLKAYALQMFVSPSLC